MRGQDRPLCPGPTRASPQLRRGCSRRDGETLGLRKKTPVTRSALEFALGQISRLTPCMKNTWKFRKVESPRPGKAIKLSDILVSDLAILLNPGKIELIPSPFVLFEFCKGIFIFSLNVQ